MNIDALLLDPPTESLPEDSQPAEVGNGSSGNSSTQCTSKGKKLTSSVWEHMTRETDPDGSLFAVCKHCKRKVLVSDSDKFANSLAEPWAELIQTVQKRLDTRIPIYAGNALSTVRYIGEFPCILSIRPTSFPVTSESRSGGHSIFKIDDAPPHGNEEEDD